MGSLLEWLRSGLRSAFHAHGMRDMRVSVLVSALLVVILLVVLPLLFWGLWQKGQPNRRLKRIRRRGKQGEEQAVGLLQRAGYAVVAAQHGGAFTVEAAQEYAQIAERVLATYGKVYFVTDLSAAALMPPETRRYFGQWARRFAATAVIYHGASLPLRAVAMLLLNAARLIGKHVRAVELFVDSEQEARVAIARIKANQKLWMSS